MLRVGLIETPIAGLGSLAFHFGVKPSLIFSPCARNSGSARSLSKASR